MGVRIVRITTNDLLNLKPGPWLSQPLGHGKGVLMARRTADNTTFYYRYTLPNGKRDFFPFATFDKAGANGGITLKQANDKVSELSLLRREHPELRLYLTNQQAQEAAKLQQEIVERKTATLEVLLTGYIEYLSRQGKTGTAQDVKGIFTRRVFKPFPDLALVKANLVTPQQLKQIIAAVVTDGKGREASKLRSFLSAAFSAAIKSDSDPEIPPCLHGFNLQFNPVANIASLSRYNQARDTFLTKVEFKVFWEKIQDVPGVTGSALRLCVMLGGQRPFQLLRLQHKDLNLEEHTVTLYDPKGRRLIPRRHILPLPEAARLELAALMGNSPFLFSSTGGRVPLNVKALSNKVVEISREMIENDVRREPFQLRDIRRTIETTLASFAVPMEVRAQLQSHGLSGVQVRHYDRYDYMEEKLGAMEKLARFLDEKPAKVVSIRAAIGTTANVAGKR